jgi:hypothetical protein
VNNLRLIVGLCQVSYGYGGHVVMSPILGLYYL